MKISTEIHKSSSGKWKWEFKIISYDKYYDLAIKKHVRKSSSKHFENYTSSLEKAEEKIEELFYLFKYYIIEYKNKEKLWEWDTKNNEFKEIKGGC